MTMRAMPSRSMFQTPDERMRTRAPQPWEPGYYESQFRADPEEDARRTFINDEVSRDVTARDPMLKAMSPGGWGDFDDQMVANRAGAAWEGKDFDVRGGGTAPALRGLQGAVRGGGMGGGGGAAIMDDSPTGNGEFDDLLRRLQLKQVNEQLHTPSRQPLGQNLSDEELHGASAGNYLADEAAIGAGRRYNFPEVAGPRNQDIANRLAQLTRQYVDPANIKAEADMGAAAMGLEGQTARADATREAARMSGAAAIRAAQARAGGQQGAADASLIGELSKYGFDDPKQQQALLGLIAALRQQGVIR